MRTTSTFATLVAALVLSGCSSTSGAGTADPAPTVHTRDADVVEVQPGGPGEPSTTVVAGDEGGWNHDDIAFVQMMLPHHR